MLLKGVCQMATEYYIQSTVYQATVGHHNYGFWVSEEQALQHIKECVPDAVPFEGTPGDPANLPHGQYYIQKRALLSFQKP